MIKESKPSGHADICFEWRLSIKQSFDLRLFIALSSGIFFVIPEICFVYFRNVIRFTEIALK